MLKCVILSLFLISYSKCRIIMTKVDIDSGSMTTLNTSLTDITYFYMTLEKSDIAGNLYFYFTDNNYTLNINILKVCSTTDDPNIPSTLTDCDWKDIDPYNKKIDSTPKEYYYKYTYLPNIYPRYIIIKYFGQNSDGELKVKSSLTDLFEKLKDLVDSALPVLAIIGIVIGSIIGFIFVLAIIAGIVTSCIKKKDDETNENTDSTNKNESYDKGSGLLMQDLTAETQN